jgi:hypothetical protein
MLLKDDKDSYILKIAQRGNASLQREYETLLRLKKFSKIYNFYIPEIYSNKKIKSRNLKNKFHFLQKWHSGLTLSKLIQEKKIKLNKAKKTSEILIDILYTITQEDLKNCVNEKPSELFRKLIMIEYQNLIKRPHLNFITSKANLKIENKYYQKLENSLDKIFSKKVFLNLDNQDKFLVDMGHFNFHGENILISDLKTLNKFKLIDPDTRWKILDPMFSMARYFYTYSHDTAESKNYYIKSNIFDFKNNDKNLYFNTKMLWASEINKVYKKMFNAYLIKKKINRVERLRFNLSYLLCLMRGTNANYEEKITFLNNKNDVLQNNGIFLALLAIEYAHQIAFEK